ncbi:carbohydrate kinase family protein [Candidatus Woesearchaeota archaeon]|nr:carbohydrate kinase family protein [Candidatus Woesearchaeota archaeon]
MYDVITIGSATVDVFVNTHKDKVVKAKHHKTEEFLTCYPLGSKMLIKDLNFTTGGGGTNTAASFSKLGLKTAYCGNIGDDMNGEMVVQDLKKHGIDFIGTKSDDKTNYSVILDSVKHDRTILAYKEASSKLDLSRLNKNKLKAKCFYFSSMIGKSFQTSLKLMEYALGNKIKVAFNPSTYEVEKGKSKLKPCLKKTDVLIFNKEEASILAGMDYDTDINTLLSEIRKLGPKILVITQGSKGAFCSDGINIYSIKSRDIEVVETTGAGDAFASGFVTGIIKDKDIEFCMKLGLVQAESVIQHHGAKNRLLSWSQALKDMKNCPDVKISKI